MDRLEGGAGSGKVDDYVKGLEGEPALVAVLLQLLPSAVGSWAPGGVCVALQDWTGRGMRQGGAARGGGLRCLSEGRSVCVRAIVLLGSANQCVMGVCAAG